MTKLSWESCEWIGITLPNIRNITENPRILFHYDSLLPKFYGTRVSCRNGSCDLSDFYVIAQRFDTEVFEVGSVVPPKIENGITQVLGTLTQRIVHEDDKFVDERTKPFDVVIHAYDPINDISYKATIYGIDIGKIEYKTDTYQKCHFVAHGIIPWTKK